MEWFALLLKMSRIRSRLFTIFITKSDFIENVSLSAANDDFPQLAVTLKLVGYPRPQRSGHVSVLGKDGTQCEF